ncbi:heme-binding protein [Maricaulis sp.]|uniref:SOUL family heme-binding protein n=1 Tax=Maricaulis sp. TaxID=1486257 RepID=UPI0025C05F52|nr:heme-binding protein [Maricaulis sp.]
MTSSHFLAIALSVASLGFAAPARAAEEPAHTVLLRDGAIEIRDYAPQITASVEVNGSMARAGNSGFRPLANYIFGGNTARDGAGADEIAMTTPVTQTRSQEIAMTSPVTQSMQGRDDWRVSFIMPDEWSLDTLPIPNDPQVQIREVPARRMAVIRFSGGASDSRFEARYRELVAYLDAGGYERIGDPVYARYDPPWIPTPFRRNEVMIEIAAS